jgi:hypothetical protein
MSCQQYRTKKNMDDDRKRSGEERIADHTSRHDNQKTARNTWYDSDAKTALKIRYLVEAMDEEEISFHEQTTQNLVIETGLDGIESAKRNYTLREIELKKPALMMYTDGSIIGEERGVGVYCEAKGLEAI